MGDLIMSEELLQRDLIKNPEKIGTWNFYNIGSTTISALKKYDIIRSIDYGNVSNKRVDAIITKQKEVIAIVEFKSPEHFNTKDKKNNAILQEIEVAKKLKTKLIIATDTKDTVWFNVATGNTVKTEEANDFKYPFDSKDINLPKVINEIIQSINEKNDRILPKELVNPTDLAKQIWQDVWSVSGATPDNCLYTFVELFIFKYLSDLKILQGTYNFYTLLGMYEEGNETNTVLQHYANIIRPQIKELFPENALDKTTIINGSIFISKEQKAVDGYGIVFKKVLQKFKNYGKLEHIDHDFKSKLFESFLKESISKKNWGQFFTPIKVVRAINEMAEGELKEGMTICDPACGVGKFPLEFIKNDLDKLFKVENNKIIQKVKIVGFDKGFDKDEQKTIILAKANMLIYFCELIKDNIGLTREFAKIFNESFVLKTNSILGTLSEAEEEKYDLILTNPPYVTSGSSNLKEEIAKNTTLKNYYKINAMGIEGLFMEWIIKALKKGGKAFIVIPDGIFNRQNDKNLRQYILDSCYIDAIISLPLKTFFTTTKKTYILAITKKFDISDIQTDPVFTYLVSEIGESRDVNRFDIEQDDLKEAVNLYNAFKGNKKYFANLNHDKRCKIVLINEFDSGKNWSVERWWSKEEKIELAIGETDQMVSISEFSDIIRDLGMICNEFSKSLQDSVLYKFDNEIGRCQSIKIEDIFNIKKGIAKYTKTYIKEHEGSYPVYSANTKQDGVLGYINHFDHEVESIQITTNGYAGTVFYRSKHKFSINGDARLYIPKCDNLDCLYLSFELQKALDKNNFNWEYKPTIERTRNIEGKIPITTTGEFDLPKQQEIAKKYCKIEEIKTNIKRELEKIETIKVDIGL
ncbi:N-6 DNA methylase [Candidatus Tisiphia endosymbiont of Mystacides longicornis]|uniref:N-6 DNA methylase n=1 Tax=Candidatus Tisiphia endosymbiont of Mystacides longicornis TaxID=3139330 RepID=UPI003CCB71C6